MDFPRLSLGVRGIDYTKGQLTCSDRRFAGFDIYDFAFLARPSHDGSRLNLLGDAARRIHAEASALNLL